MNLHRYLRLIAGCIVGLSLLLGLAISPNWFWLTAAVSVNLIQSAFTNWCPMMVLLRKLGIKEE